MAKRPAPARIDFFKVALQRFEEAQILLKNKKNVGAMYLAGYTVECMLKPLLLRPTPPK